MTFEELKQDKTFRKLLVLLPKITCTEHEITISGYRVANATSWYYGAHIGYLEYSSFDFNQWHKMVLKYR